MSEIFSRRRSKTSISVNFTVEVPQSLQPGRVFLVVGGVDDEDDPAWGVSGISPLWSGD